ncbi:MULTISPECIES: winged helix-turn-helix domain-containing protein [Streptomyces]|uniref:GntR family transcriptional regulator n=1 Tax=Streptomyces venezuelae TaxID=54571 RepID=A0A5P2AU65_STRVZ|nr:winged helix-turn-helix domain-containing protein [Streptomyces venezuelae]QES20431.1 GntR family transcriptional regulator [Streptomyces venezuelae]
MANSSPRGTYLLIAAALRKRIEDGEVRSALPSETQLMAEHSVSRNTIRRALKVLADDRVIRSTPGVGWQVGGGNEQRPLAERLIDLITEDSLAIGDAYPSESKLCERFQVSRTAVRRALGQLEGSGLLETTHGKGRKVRGLPTSPEQP